MYGEKVCGALAWQDLLDNHVYNTRMISSHNKPLIFFDIKNKRFFIPKLITSQLILT
jgi:hypothetical protein